MKLLQKFDTTFFETVYVEEGRNVDFIHLKINCSLIFWGSKATRSRCDGWYYMVSLWISQFFSCERILKIGQDLTRLPLCVMIPFWGDTVYIITILMMILS